MSISLLRSYCWRFVVVVASLLVMQAAALAANVFYLPGDAFFHVALYRHDIVSFDARDNIFLKYCPAAPGTFSGYIGYHSIELSGLSPEFRSNFSTACKLIRISSPLRVRAVQESVYEDRKDGPVIRITGKTTEIEENPVSMFIYNRSFQIKKCKIGLKYNETWPLEAAKFTAGDRSIIALDEFPGTYASVVESWGQATSVEPLDVAIPDEPIRRLQAIKMPLKLRGEVKLVLCPHQDFKSIYEAADEIEFYVVSKDELRWYTVVDGEWREQPIPKLIEETSR